MGKSDCRKGWAGFYGTGLWVYMMEKQVEKKNVYSGVEGLPTGRAGDRITEGCLCLEGGGWRGLYTVGVLDALMVNDINLRTTIGISAGALSGIGYVAGQIGWSAGIDLQYRHDPRYCGRDALLIEHGIMGYRYLFNRLVKDSPLDKRRLKSPERRLYVGATNMLTGEIEYFEKGTSNIYLAAAASASVPYLSKPVMIDGVPYLDGACVEKIPYPFAKELGEEKIVIVKTRERDYRRKEGKNKAAGMMYRRYPAFVAGINAANGRSNEMADELEREEREGNVFLIAPSQKVEVSRFDGDMEKLGDLYWLGYHDTEDALPALMDYLEETMDE